MKLSIIALCLATLALAACRRETATYEPLKLGGPTQGDASR